MLNKPNFLFRILTKYSSWIFFDIPKTMLGCLLSVYTVHSIYIFLQFTTYVCTLYNVQLNNCTLVHSTNTVDSFFYRLQHVYTGAMYSFIITYVHSSLNSFIIIYMHSSTLYRVLEWRIVSSGMKLEKRSVKSWTKRELRYTF